MNKVDKALVFAAADKFEQVKATFRTLFQSYVQDKSNPISERLMVWECHACNALLIADYRSDIDKDLCEILIAEEAERYQLISFQDLAEHIIPDDLWDKYYGDPEEDGMEPEKCIELICKDYPEIAEKFELVFASEFSGFVNDW
ncbi:putative D11 protein [Escherichia phage JLBYU43]|uniref:D11 protein n=1 Tax=Escherichia phage JLBYU43 TaxID=2894751 RepID=A0AAE8YY18_9CAUD|nr:putative D11 protein [Escherichia phage JLBYU43]